MVKLSKCLDFSFDFLVFLMRLGNGNSGLVGSLRYLKTPVYLRQSMTA